MVEVILDVCRAITETLLDEGLNVVAQKLRIKALREVIPIGYAYRDEFHNEALAVVICKKKIAFLMDAATQKETQDILSPPNVRYDGNKVRPANQYVIPEEELLLWSLTSLRGPLVEAGFRRFEELFMEVFPEHGGIWEKYT